MMLPPVTSRRAELLRALLAAGALAAADPTLEVALRATLADLDRATGEARRRLPEPGRRRLLAQDIDRLWAAITASGPAR
jgi:hypothetical protein